MTQYISDLSHYDPVITLAIAKKMVSEGIVMATHKVSEGTGGDDPEDGTSLKNLRDAGMPILGGYGVVRSGSVSPQVKNLIALADRDESWWRKFPYWVWQVDLERWSYDNVPASTGISFGKLLRQETQRPVILYGSKGQYGDELKDWDGPLWNANYGHNPVGDFKTIYPGDKGAGWVMYSGKMPLLWQYGSNVNIAGMITCDISAFRGTLDQLKEALFGDDMATPDEILDRMAVRLQDPTDKLTIIMKAIAWQYKGGGLAPNKSTLNTLYDIWAETTTPDAPPQIDADDLATKLAPLINGASVDVVKAAITEVIGDTHLVVSPAPTVQ